MPRSRERFARQHPFGPPPEFPLASPCPSIAHHLSGLNIAALSRCSRGSASLRSIFHSQQCRTPWSVFQDGSRIFASAPAPSGLLTLSPKCFSPFAHATCALSGPPLAQPWEELTSHSHSTLKLRYSPGRQVWSRTGLSPFLAGVSSPLRLLTCVHHISYCARALAASLAATKAVTVVFHSAD